MEKDIALGVLGAVLTLAGLLLVFCGFLVSKASSMSDTNRSSKVMVLAKVGVAPLLLSFAVSWVRIMAIQGNSWAVEHGLLLFKASLAVSAFCSVIALLGL